MNTINEKLIIKTRVLTAFEQELLECLQDRDKDGFKELLGQRDIKCENCGEKKPECLSLHHLIPKQLGGKNEMWNIAILCYNCHHAVHNEINRTVVTEETIMERLWYLLTEGEKQKEHNEWLDEEFTPDGFKEVEDILRGHKLLGLKTASTYAIRYCEKCGVQRSFAVIRFEGHKIYVCIDCGHRIQVD